MTVSVVKKSPRRPDFQAGFSDQPFKIHNFQILTILNNNIK